MCVVNIFEQAIEITANKMTEPKVSNQKIVANLYTNL